MTSPAELLDYELFRNGVVVGRIRLGVPEESRPQGMVLGMLEPTAEFDDIRQMIQTHVRTLPGQPVFQHDVPGGRSPVGHDWVSGGRLNPVVLPGVPPERVLTLHRVSGEIVEVDAIIIGRMDDQVTIVALRDFCLAHGLEISPWNFVAHLRPSATSAS